MAQAGVASIKPQYLVQQQNGESKDKSEDKVEEGGTKRRGQNKKRHKSNKVSFFRSDMLCDTLCDIAEEEDFPTCGNANCKKQHDIAEYMKTLTESSTGECPIFALKGHCKRGLNCVFALSHVTPEGKNKRCLDKLEQFNFKPEKNVNFVTQDLRVNLRKRKYNFDKANKCVNDVLKRDKPNDGEQESKKIGFSEEPIAKVERRPIDWTGKLYLSPLTTLGNLPFRRVCKKWGADITCGEMALAARLLQGSTQEWALLRKHSSEGLFGVQICGNNPHVIARCAQLIEENTEIDFIDLNLGCPIEWLYRQGAGSGLLGRRKTLESVIYSLARSTSLPFTVKTRTGVYENQLIADTLMPLYTTAGASLITVHGRTREQRYTRFADWDYIEKCAKAAQPTPVFGNGDILSYHDYYNALEQHPSVAGIMIGRGALYKPWIFTEIKERRDWDISSQERLEILKEFVNYGLDHWGSDKQGVGNTRRFLLEWLSFLHRYIPVGLLEVIPQKINERPPRYMGRDDLETLMASPNCADWIKISEMLLGPVPEGFQFLPKHKASAWAS